MYKHPICINPFQEGMNTLFCRNVCIKIRIYKYVYSIHISYIIYIYIIEREREWERETYVDAILVMHKIPSQNPSKVTEEIYSSRVYKTFPGILMSVLDMFNFEMH